LFFQLCLAYSLGNSSQLKGVQRREYVISPREVVMAQRLPNFVSRFRRELMVVLRMLCAMLALAPGSPAQTDDSYQSRRTQAFALYENNNFVDALPLLEKLHEEKPGDVAVLERLSFATLAHSARRANVSERKQGAGAGEKTCRRSKGGGGR
jgi:hypothetical protein